MATKPSSPTVIAKDEVKLKLRELEREIDGQERTSEVIASSGEKDDDTRQKVAKKFVNYYFLLLAVIVVGVPAYNATMYAVTQTNDLSISIKDAVLTYSAVVGPTFGLVVAYYFKSKHD